MTHTCRLLHHNQEVQLDACCQYGADVDLQERDQILQRRADISALLDREVAERGWFRNEVRSDPDFPSGQFVRTRLYGGRCVFLAHDQRGCAIHRAALEGGWDFRGVKPHVCRLFPLTYDSESIVVSDDYPDYSCSRDPRAPSLYRASRDALGDVFGAELVAALDAAERSTL